VSLVFGYFYHQNSKQNSKMESAQASLRATLHDFNQSQKYAIQNEQFETLEKNHSLSHEQIEKLKKALGQ